MEIPAPVSWEYDDTHLLGKEPFRFAVINDSADPWGMGIKSYDGAAEYFELMTTQAASEFAGLPGIELNPVYISEDGLVRTIVESLFSYKNSRIHVRYFIPENKPGFDVEITVYWMEKDRFLKWIIPVGFNMNCIGRSISGINCFKHRKRPHVKR